MKVKYLRLNKEEKLKAKEAFYKSNVGIIVKKQITISVICSIFCIIFAILMVTYSYIAKTSIWDKIYGLCVFAFGYFGLILARKIFVKKINDFVIKNKF